MASSTCWGSCCTGGERKAGTASQPVKTIPVWRSPHYHPVERLLNLVFHKILPVAEMADLSLEKDSARIQEIRERIRSADSGHYERRILRAGWRAEEVSFARPGGGGECSVFVHRPPGADDERLPLLYWLHGGGMTVCDARQSYGAGMVAELLERGVRVVWATTEYRLAPEHPFPAGFDDSLDGLRHLLRSPELSQRFGFDPECVHLGGVSAGGNLVAAVAGAVARDGGAEAAAVRSVFVDQPMLDPAMDSDSYVENADARIAPVPWLAWCWDGYLRGFPGGALAAREDARVCPHLHPPAAAGGNIPPQLVITASGDALRDEGWQYVSAMRAAGAEVEHIEARGSHALALMFDKVHREATFQAWVKHFSRANGHAP